MISIPDEVPNPIDHFIPSTHKSLKNCIEHQALMLILPVYCRLVLYAQVKTRSQNSFVKYMGQEEAAEVQSYIVRIQKNGRAVAKHLVSGLDADNGCQ